MASLVGESSLQEHAAASSVDSLLSTVK